MHHIHTNSQRRKTKQNGRKWKENPIKPHRPHTTPVTRGELDTQRSHIQRIRFCGLRGCYRFLPTASGNGVPRCPCSVVTEEGEICSLPFTNQSHDLESKKPGCVVNHKYIIGFIYTSFSETFFPPSQKIYAKSKDFGGRSTGPGMGFSYSWEGGGK